MSSNISRVYLIYFLRSNDWDFLSDLCVQPLCCTDLQNCCPSFTKCGPCRTLDHTFTGPCRTNRTTIITKTSGDQSDFVWCKLKICWGRLNLLQLKTRKTETQKLQMKEEDISSLWTLKWQLWRKKIALWWFMMRLCKSVEFESQGGRVFHRQREREVSWFYTTK